MYIYIYTYICIYNKCHGIQTLYIFIETVDGTVRRRRYTLGRVVQIKRLDERERERERDEHTLRLSLRSAHSNVARAAEELNRFSEGLYERHVQTNIMRGMVIYVI